MCLAIWKAVLLVIDIEHTCWTKDEHIGWGGLGREVEGAMDRGQYWN